MSASELPAFRPLATAATAAATEAPASSPAASPDLSTTASPTIPPTITPTPSPSGGQAHVATGVPLGSYAAIQPADLTTCQSADLGVRHPVYLPANQSPDLAASQQADL